jgi:hypothetical protein
LETDSFDWLAIVLLGCVADRPRRLFLVPREVADAKARRNGPTTKVAQQRYWRIDEIAKLFPEFEDNFSLDPNGVPVTRQRVTVGL